MAHKGKYWPVAFRRDLNLNSPNNNLGFARRYIGNCVFSATGFGAVLSGVDFDCGPDFYPDRLTAAWASEFQQLGFFFYQMQLTVQIPDGINFLRQISYFVRGFGTILVLNYGHPAPPNTPGFPTGYTLDVAFWSLDWFDSEPGPFDTGIAPKTWLSPAPH